MGETKLIEKLKKISENQAKIYFISKVLHWNSNKYDEHLLYDRIGEGTIDNIDEIAEACIFPFTKISDLDLKIDKFDLEALKDLITDTADEIQKICQDSETAEGIKNTLSGIASQLNVKAYLIKNNL